LSEWGSTLKSEEHIFEADAPLAVESRVLIYIPKDRSLWVLFGNKPECLQGDALDVSAVVPAERMRFIGLAARKPNLSSP
jgi:hypothetical protein